MNETRKFHGISYNIDGVDLLALGSLCQEYEVQWVIDRIVSYIVDDEVEFDNMPYRTQLRLLKLLFMIDKEADEDGIPEDDTMRGEMIHCLKESFQVLKMTEEFSWLPIPVKILVARKCLFIIGEKKFSKPLKSKKTKLGRRKIFKLLTNAKDCGLLRLLEEHSQNEFAFKYGDKRKNDDEGIQFILGTRQ